MRAIRTVQILCPYSKLTSTLLRSIWRNQSRILSKETETESRKSGRTAS